MTSRTVRTPHPRSSARGQAPALALLGLIALVTLLAAARAQGQEMEPRIYSNAPVGMNFFIAAYSHSRGGLSTQPDSALTDAHLTVDAPLVAYARVIDVGGRSAKLDAVMGGAKLSGSALFAGKVVTRDISGLLDPAFRFSSNFIGAPALKLPEYASYKQNLIVGASLLVSVPIGQYDPNRLVNLGANRWLFRPELGVSKALGRITLEGALAASLFTTNDDYFGGRTREQDPVYSTRGNLLLSSRRGFWVSLNATYYTGGRTRLDDLRQDDKLSSSRLGATLTLPLNRRNSLKLHASSGLSVRTGTDFDIAGAAWQHRWGGGL